MENSETLYAFTNGRHNQQDMPLYQNPFECALKLRTPLALSTSPDTSGNPGNSQFTSMEGFPAVKTENDTMPTPVSSLHGDQCFMMPSDHQSLSYWHPQPVIDPLYTQSRGLPQSRDEATSQGSLGSASSMSQFDIESFQRQDFDDYLSTPSLTESPTTTSSRPRSTMIPDLAWFESLPVDAIDQDSVDSPASYVLEPNSNGRHGQPQTTSSTQFSRDPWDRLRSTTTQSGNEMFGTPSPTISHLSMQPPYCPPVGHDLQSEQAEHHHNRPGREDLDDDPNSAEPYAKLIYRALMSQPDHTMVLKEIYEWFEKNTNKASDPASRGWQNSIRHNLSMNAAFMKRDHPNHNGGTSKPTSVWVLSPEAISTGVKSTTRYRKQGNSKKGNKSSVGAPQRVTSGRKGGLAAKKAARRKRDLLKHAQELDIEIVDHVHGSFHPPSHSPVTPLDMTPSRFLGSSFDPSCSPIQSTNTLNPTPFEYRGVIGVADVDPDMPIFTDSELPSERRNNDFSLFDGADSDCNMDPFFRNL